MKRFAFALCLVLLTFATTPELRNVRAQAKVPEMSYESVPDFLKLPADLYFGEVSGVAVNSKGHIFVLSRGNTSGPAYGAAAAQFWSLARTGASSREIGHNLYAWSFAHMVKVDPQDNIWVTDKGSDMVIEFNPEGRVVMVFGRKQEASDEGTGPLKHLVPPLPPVDGMFRQVTDVAWDAAGNTYISDGYINSRVAKVDKDGNWLKSWGEPGADRAVQRAAQYCRGCVRPRLRGRSRQSPHTGFRWRRQVSPAVSQSMCRLTQMRVPPSATSRLRAPVRWRPARRGRSALLPVQIR